MPVNALEFRAVAKSFGACRVLEDVSFDVAPGEALGLMQAVVAAEEVEP